jgi:hypothetical protein
MFVYSPIANCYHRAKEELVPLIPFQPAMPNVLRFFLQLFCASKGYSGLRYLPLSNLIHHDLIASIISLDILVLHFSADHYIHMRRITVSDPRATAQHPHTYKP